MSIVKWTPFIDRFDEMDKFFEKFPSVVDGEKSGFVPAIDMYENEKEIVVEAQLAGIDPKKVNVSVEENVLTIKGEGEKRTEVDDKNYYRKEIRRGNFCRSIQLPASVVGEKSEAETVGGVLKISIPKNKTGEKKNIKVKIK